MFGNYLRSFALGAASGGRTFAPIAIISLADSTGRLPVGPGSLGLVNSPALGRLLQLAAAGELVADKLPFIPNRTRPGSVAGRTALGGISAAIMANKTGDSTEVAACIGALSAVVSTFVLYHVRRSITRQGAPDFAVAVSEDAGVILSSLAAVGSIPFACSHAHPKCPCS